MGLAGAVTVLSALLLLPTAARADEREAEACLRPKVWEASRDGWGLRTSVSATLALGATRSYAMTLYLGNSYRFQTCADKRTRNLDVLIYDAEGQVVARDATTNREPELVVTPEQTGTYYVVLHARELTDQGAEVGAALAVSYK